MGTENLHRLGRPIIANRRLAEKRPIVGRVLSKGAQPVRAMPNILTRTQIILLRHCMRVFVGVLCRCEESQWEESQWEEST